MWNSVLISATLIKNKPLSRTFIIKILKQRFITYCSVLFWMDCWHAILAGLNVSSWSSSHIHIDFPVDTTCDEMINLRKFHFGLPHICMNFSGNSSVLLRKHRTRNALLDRGLCNYTPKDAVYVITYPCQKPSWRLGLLLLTWIIFNSNIKINPMASKTWDDIT